MLLQGPMEQRTEVEVSVVVPLYNEGESITPLVEAVRAALGKDLAWELVLVDDGSDDDTGDIAEILAARDARIRVVRLGRNYGQAVAMQAGFDYSRGGVVVTMDGDLQNDPEDIPLLLAELEKGYELVAGYRENRQDRYLTRRLPSALANRLIGRITGTHMRDYGCTLKAYRRELLERLRLYSDQHRFIPALATSWGARIAEIPVRHHPRRYGKSKYGLSRTGVVLADLLAVKLLVSFRTNPLAGFGILALLSAIPAVLFAVMWVVALLFFTTPKAESLVFPGAALLWLAVALYLFLLGLVAEVALVANPDLPGPEPLLREIT